MSHNLPDNERIAREFFAAPSAGDHPRLERLFAADAVWTLIVLYVFAAIGLLLLLHLSDTGTITITCCSRSCSPCRCLCSLP